MSKFRLLIPPLFLLATAATPAPTSQPTTTAATQPTTQPHERRFISMPDILNKTPDNLRPREYSPDWTRFDEYKFKDWVNKQIAGMTFNEELQLAGAGIHPNPTTTPGHEWQVDLSFNLTQFPCFGSTHGWAIAVPPLTTTESSARKWEHIKPGTRIKIKATIKAVYMMRRNFTSTPHPQYEFALILDNPELTPPK